MGKQCSAFFFGYGGGQVFEECQLCNAIMVSQFTHGQTIG